MTNKESNLFDIAACVLNKAKLELIKHKKGEAIAEVIIPSNTGVFSSLPSQQELLAKLEVYGFYKTAGLNISLDVGIMGCVSTPVVCGGVVFILFDNWDNNPDGMNRIETLTPFSLKDNRTITPFFRMDDYSNPKYTSSVLMTIFGKSFGHVSEFSIDQGD